MAQNLSHQAHASGSAYGSGNAYRYPERLAGEGNVAFTDSGNARDTIGEQDWQAGMDVGQQYSVAWDSRDGAHFSAGQSIASGVHPPMGSSQLGTAPQQYQHPSPRPDLPVASQHTLRDVYHHPLDYTHSAAYASHCTTPYDVHPSGSQTFAPVPPSPPQSMGVTGHPSERYMQAPSGMVTQVVPPVWHPEHRGVPSLHVPFALRADPRNGPSPQNQSAAMLPPQPHLSFAWHPQTHAVAIDSQTYPSPLPAAYSANQPDSRSWANPHASPSTDSFGYTSSGAATSVPKSPYVSSVPSHHAPQDALPSHVGKIEQISSAQDGMNRSNVPEARGIEYIGRTSICEPGVNSTNDHARTLQLLLPGSPHPEYYALERIPATSEPPMQRALQLRSGPMTNSPETSHPSLPGQYDFGVASTGSNSGDFPDPLHAFLYHGQAYRADCSSSNSPAASPWLDESSYGPDMAARVSGLDSSMSSSLSGSPGAAQDLRPEGNQIDRSGMLAAVLASGGPNLAPDALQVDYGHPLTSHGQQAYTQASAQSVDASIETQDSSAKTGTAGRSSRSQKKADKQGASAKKEVRLEEGRCETCSVVFADIYLRGVTDDFKPAFNLRYTCIDCHGALSPLPDSHESALARSMVKKRARALDPLTSAVCDVCTRKVAIGGPIPQNDEDDLLFNVEIVCSRCKERYSRCSDCGGGGGVRLGVGKWRCKELFTPGRKTCRLSHARQASVASMQYVTNRTRDIRQEELPDILQICKGVFSSAIYSTVAVPEILERGTTAAKSYQDVVDMVEVGWHEARTLIEEDIEDSLGSRRYLGLRYSAPRPRKSVSRKAPVASAATDPVSPTTPVLPIVHTSEGSLLRNGMHLAGYVTGEWDIYKGAFYISCSVPYSTGEQYEGAAHLISLLVKRAVEDRKEYVAELTQSGKSEEAARVLPILHVWTMLFFTPESKLSTFLESKRQLIPLERYLEKYPDTDPTIFPPHRPVAPRVREMPGWCCLVRRNILPSAPPNTTGQPKHSGNMRSGASKKVVTPK